MAEWKITIGENETVYTSFEKMKNEFNNVMGFIKTKPKVKCYDDFPDEYKSPILYLSTSVSEDMYYRFNKIPSRCASYGGKTCVLTECFDRILNKNEISFDEFLRFLEIKNANPFVITPRGKYMFGCEYEIGKAFCELESYINACKWAKQFKPIYNSLINDLSTSSIVIAVFDNKDFSSSTYKKYKINCINDITNIINEFRDDLIVVKRLGMLGVNETKDIKKEWDKLSEKEKLNVFNTIVDEYNSTRGYISNITANVKYVEMIVGFKEFELPHGIIISFRDNFVLNFRNKIYKAFDKKIKNWSRKFSVDNPNDYNYFGWSLD